MKTLFVSDDCGVTYSPLMKSESVDELLKRTEKKSDKWQDISWCRWYIEDDEKGMDYEHISPIHKQIIDTMTRIRLKEILETENKEEPPCPTK